MSPIDRLSALFERFPGIGPRQAQRFVQYLLRSSPSLRRDLAEAIHDLGGSVRQCPVCFRFWAQSSSPSGGHTKDACDICANPLRDHHALAVVATDADFAALERSGTYRGLYFVLGGTISLANEKNSPLRFTQLLARVNGQNGDELKEVIIALPANPEGDATEERVREELSLIAPMNDITITSLGRGLSTGSELEYADSETIKNALDNRR